jgi:hypothetical protein
MSQLDGIWVNVPLNQIQKSPHRHPPFSDAYRPFFEKMSRLFAEFDLGSADAWEDDFRRDTHPEREMALWKQLASCYEHFLQDGQWTFESRKELFCLLMSCMSFGPKHALRELNIRHISRPKARTVVEYVTKVTNGRVQPIVIGNSCQEE